MLKALHHPLPHVVFATAYDEMVRLTKGERGKRLDDAQGTHVESVTRRPAASEVQMFRYRNSRSGKLGSAVNGNPPARPVMRLALEYSQMSQ